MAKQVASLYGVLSLDDKNFTQAIGVAKSGILNLGDDLKSAGDGFAASVGRLGNKLQEIGGQMTVLGGAITTITGPLVGFGQGAVEASTSFDESMKNIQAAAGYTGDEMVAISQQVLDIGTNSRYGANEAAVSFYEIAGGVTDASSRMAIFEASVKAAQAGNADLGATTSAMIGIMNSYSFGADQASFASDVLTRTVGMGKGSMEEFGTSLAKAAMLAPGLNIGLDDLASAMAYMTTKNIPATESATMLKSMMTTLLSPTKDLADAIHNAGYESGEAMIKAEGLTGAYNTLKDNNGGTLSGLITNTEALAGATTLANDEFAKFDTTFKGSTVATWNGQTGSAAAMTTFSDGIKGATDAAENVQMDSTAAQFDLLNSSVEKLNITVGTTLTQTLTDLSNNVLMPLVGQVNDWISANPQAAMTIMLIVGAAFLLGGALTIAGTAITAIGTALTILSGPIGLAILAVALLGAAYMSNFGGIKDFIDGTVAPIIEEFFNFLGGVWDLVKQPLSDLANWFVSTGMTKIAESLKDAKTKLDALIFVMAGIWEAAKPGIEKLSQNFSEKFGPILKAIGDAKAALDEFLRLLNSINPSSGAFLSGGVVSEADFNRMNSGGTGGGDVAVGGGTDGGMKTTGGNVPTSMGGKAAGGPVMGGMPYTVGEQGREVFVPESNGTIIPNGQAEGMGGVQIGTVIIQANDAAGGQAAAERFDTRLKELRAARG